MVLDNRRTIGIIRQSATTLFLIAVVTSLSVAMGTTAWLLRSADAIPQVDAQGDVDSEGGADFDIRNYGFDDDGNPYIQVYGLAGRTIVEEGDHHAVLVYALVGKDINGVSKIWVIDSHDFEHDPDEHNERELWHGQIVKEVSQGCFDVVSTESESRIVGKRATMVNTDAVEISFALTAELEFVGEEVPIPNDGICDAQLHLLFDDANLGTVTK